MDTARQNGISWDAVISCEAIGKYKVLPEAYKTCAKFLQLDPGECCMVACHNFDLNAAKACGYRTAFVRRPDEWGAAGPPDPEPHPQHDLVVAGERLSLVLRRWSAFGLPLPMWLCPRSDSYESTEQGRFNFHVRIGHPLTGLIVRYDGWLVRKSGKA